MSIERELKGTNQYFPGKPGFAEHVDAREHAQDFDMKGGITSMKPINPNPHGAPAAPGLTPALSKKLAADHPIQSARIQVIQRSKSGRKR